MTLDLAQIGMTVMALGLAAVVACNGWHRNPTDHLTAALSTGWHAVTSLYAKGPRT